MRLKRLPAGLIFAECDDFILYKYHENEWGFSLKLMAQKVNKRKDKHRTWYLKWSYRLQRLCRGKDADFLKESLPVIYLWIHKQCIA
jgi:hypothetical protein